MITVDDGVLYPPGMVEFVSSRGTDVLDVAPRADDVWLNHCALRVGYRDKQIADRPASSGLAAVTSVTSEPFRPQRPQIAATHSSEDVAKLRAAE